MAKGHEGFNKRENEKKRQKKRQEKEERREERQAKKGQSFEEMLAYVDEFGNITSTPPDPNRKREEVNLEDIQLGARRRDDEEGGESAVRRGVVSNFNTAKGYGFIKDQQSGESVFVHVSALVDKVREGDRVTFETERGPRGLNATNVRRADAAPAATPPAADPAL